MGFWSNLRDDFNRITRPYDEQEDEPMEFEDQDEEETPRPERPERRKTTSYQSKVVNLHSSNAQLKVVLMKPVRFNEDAREIAEHLLSKRTVLINLEKTNPESAQRIMDYLDGVTFAIGGELKPVAAKTYIATPYTGGVEGTYISELEQEITF